MRVIAADRPSSLGARDTPRLDILADVKAMASDMDLSASLGDAGAICICPFEGGVATKQEER